MKSAFINRNFEKDVFEKSLIEVGQKSNPSIVVFYGPGGIGKSALYDELKQKTNTKNRLYSYINLSGKGHIETYESISILRNNIQAENTSKKIECPIFDYAYEIFWGKRFPAIPISIGEFGAFNKRGGIASEVIETAGVPGVNLAYKITKNLRKRNKIKELFKRNPYLSEIESLEFNKIEKLLPQFLIMDIGSHIKKSNIPMIIFFDTFEEISTSKIEANLGDEYVFNEESWVRNLVSYSRKLKLPILFSIFSRNKINWSNWDKKWEILLDTQIKLTPLTKESTNELLKRYKIYDPKISNEILSNSKGNPLSISLQVSTYNNLLSQNKHPTLKHFKLALSKNIHTDLKIVSCFLKNTNFNERELIQILSVPKSFDIDVANKLRKHFELPLSLYYVETVFIKYNFIEKINESEFRIHQLLSESIKKITSSVIINKARRWLFENEFSFIDHNELEMSPSMTKHLVNCVYYCDWLADEDFHWFIKTSKIFIKHGEFKVFIDITNSLINKTENNNISHSLKIELFYILARSTELSGAYKQAKKHYRETLEISSAIYGDHHQDLATRLNDLGLICWQLEEYEEAISHISESLNIGQSVEAVDYEKTAIRKNNLALCYSKINRHEKAITLYKEAIYLAPDHYDTPMWYSNLCYIYTSNRSFLKAKYNLKKAYDLSLSNYGYDNYRMIYCLSNLGFFYLCTGDKLNALNYYVKTREIALLHLGKHHKITLEYNEKIKNIIKP